MPTVAVKCPECAGPLRLPTWTPGRAVRCPRCQAEFCLGDDPGTVARARPRRSANTWVQGSMVAGVILFLGVAVVVTLSFLRRETPPQPAPPVAERPTPTKPRKQEEAPPVASPRPRATTPPRKLPADLQAQVPPAIEQGLAYLRLHQWPDGRFGSVHEGTTYLVGLTLLECGVPAADPALRKVTARVRSYMTSKNAFRTYDLSLALLYLDRLDDPADRPLIQSLALRLIAGQQPDGGWSYACERLTPNSERGLLAALRATRPQANDDLLVRIDSGQFVEPSGQVHAQLVRRDDTFARVESRQSKFQAAQRDLRGYPELLNVPSMALVKDDRPDNATLKLPSGPSRDSDTDNSNTQFAALGLWIASRYDIPTERALALTAARFRTTQRAGGGWGYKPRLPEDTPAMTCAGLVGLGIGHGVRLGDAQKRQDEQIAAGLKYLAAHLQSDRGALNLYFIWSLERVGVLFNLDRVGTTDWYEWGTRRLVAAQDFDGAWSRGGYHDADAVHDTCFALLFLKQANLAGDLSQRLGQVLDVGLIHRDPPR